MGSMSIKNKIKTYSNIREEKANQLMYTDKEMKMIRENQNEVIFMIYILKIHPDIKILLI